MALFLFTSGHRYQVNTKPTPVFNIFLIDSGMVINPKRLFNLTIDLGLDEVGASRGYIKIQKATLGDKVEGDLKKYLYPGVASEIAEFAPLLHPINPGIEKK